MKRCALSTASKAKTRVSSATRRCNSSSSASTTPSTPQNITAGNDATTPTNLPFSPLMDEAFLAAREKHHEPKPRPVHSNLTPFQIQLRKNPYALALATSVRECNVSKARLPKFFLQGYNLLKRNEADEEAWWMPGDLTRPPKNTNVRDNGDASQELSDHGAKESMIGSHTVKKVISPRGQAVYTLSNQSFIRSMLRKKTVTSAFVDSQTQNHARARQLNRATRFRDDMDTFILELLRRRVVEDLTRIIELKRGYIFHYSEDVQKRQVAAYLWTGSGQGKAPGEFSTLDERGKKIPVYDLQMLLGEDKLKTFKNGKQGGLFDKIMVGVRSKNVTVELQMRLWKLQGYLAEYEEFMDQS